MKKQTQRTTKTKTRKAADKTSPSLSLPSLRSGTHASPQAGEGNKTWTNQEVGALLNRIGDILDLQGEISFKVNAYRRAADTIDHLSRSMQDLWQGDAKNLRAVPGIGEALSEKLDELFRTGRMSYYEKISRDIPAGVLEFLTIPGVGPKTAARFWKELKVTDVAQLEAALQAGKLRGLKGFSDKSEQKIRDGIAATRRKGTRRTLATVFPFANEVIDALTKATGRAITQISVGGSLRRLKATIGDIDFLAASNEADRVLDAFCSLPFVAQALAKGGTKASVVAHNGLQMDLRVLEPARWGTALQYFTGSKEHNVAIRQLALEQGWSLNEWALTNVKTNKEVLCATEEQVYERLGLEWVPPELRENFGEIDAARKHKLPKLIGWKDLKGDLQCHSTWSDGKYSIAEMAEAARARGLHYIAITDHSKSLGVTRGLDEKKLVEQWKEIDEMNKRWKAEHPHLRDFRILKSSEVEIRADGTLDYDDEWLAKFDIVIASTHSALTQPREKITSRVVKALRNPYVDVFAHPTGRLLSAREESALDMEEVFRVAKETGTLLEVDGTSDRMDLDGTHVRRALELGLKIVVDSDAHEPLGFDDLFWGLAMARRGWATQADVLNTFEWDELKKHLKRNQHA